MDAHPDDFGTTNVTVSIATLIGAGLLPANFGNRTGVTPATSITPFGQPYLVIARRLAADDDRATAIILESGTVSRDKLAQVGIEDEADDDDAAIFALKQEIAARANRSYSLISGAVPTGSSNVQGTNGAFTKDIGSYLTGGAVAEAKTVAFVNFADLDPGIDDSPVDPLAALPWRKQWKSCFYQTGATFAETLCSAGYPGPGNWPPAGGPDPNDPDKIYGYSSQEISNCAGPVILPLEMGGTMTNGWDAQTHTNFSGGNNCPNYTGSNTSPICTWTRKFGTVTMNNATIASGRCEDRWSAPGYPDHVETYPGENKRVRACCTYQWTKP